MPCDCRRVTTRYACRHKERDFLRCWRYNLRKSFSCVGVCMPTCDPRRFWTSIDRVCNDCYEFFIRLFGRRIAYEVSERFLEYKEYRGMSKEAIDPADIPFRDYISSAELADIGARASRRTRQPYRATSPMRAARPRTPPIQPRQPPPVVHRSRHGERHASHSQAQPRSASNTRHREKQVRRKPVPVPIKESHTHNSTLAAREVQHGYYNVEAQQNHNNRKPRQSRFREVFTPDYANLEVQQNRYNEDAQYNQYREEVRHSYYNSSSGNAETIQTIVEYPVLEYKTDEPIDLTDLVDDEIDDYYGEDLVYRGRALSRSPHQPIPLRSKQVFKDPRQQPSESSLVRRITDMAETIRISGYSDHESEDVPSVPVIKNPPRVPHWRVDTPRPAMAAVGGSRIRSQSAIPQPRKREVEEASPLRTAPVTSFIRTSPSLDSLMNTAGRGRTQSREIVPIPPPRTAGLQNFRERGVPSALFLKEENNEVEQQVIHESLTMLVSISTPSPAYSCAVQACFCTPEDADDQICPSCRERRRLERDLSMKWI
ncbi:hypothetical protein F5Y06DRAFT_59535 [Hypoxylon sp. FL0890]|nr:hypothetical protein F5Y06DRAFT_59535 [Hypoxylon sp. FL0890]